MSRLLLALGFAAAAIGSACADPNRRDLRNRWTPLLHAIHRQQAAAVRLLLTNSAARPRRRS